MYNFRTVGQHVGAPSHDVGMGGHAIVATEALASGALTRRELTRAYTKLYRNIYARNGVELDAAQRAVAAWLWSGRTAVVGGSSAAALSGARGVSPSEPAEVKRPPRPGG